MSVKSGDRIGVLKRTLRRPYRVFKRALQGTPGASWLLAWIDPLHIARQTLYRAMQDKAPYARGRVLDVGCGDKPYRKLFAHVDVYIGIEISPNGASDLVANALSLPFRDNSFDTILCNEVLEHVPEPKLLMSEAFRVLKSGGVLILTTPQTWGLHLEPTDYYRYTKYGLRYLAEIAGLEVIEVSPTCGLWATIAQRMSDTVINTYAIRAPFWLVGLASLLLAPFLLIGSGLDALVGRRGDTLDNVLVARRPQ